MVSFQQKQGDVTLDMDPPKRKQLRKEREELQKKLNAELKEHVGKNPTIETNVANLVYFLNNQQWNQLEELVQTTRAFDSPTEFSPPLPKIISYKQVNAVEHLFQNPTGQLNYLQLLITHFEIENVLFGKDRNAPIHYAVEALDEEFLDWLLRREDAHGGSLINVNLRNKDKKTALYMLCEKYDKSNLTSQKREILIKLIDRLVVAGADFNIYSSPKQLPFDLLLKHYDDDIAIKQLVDRIDSQSNRAIAYSVCRQNGSNERLVNFFDRAGNREVHVTPELLELFLQFDDLNNFDQHWAAFSVDQNNVKKVIELVLQVAVARKLSNIVRRIVDSAGWMIFAIREGNPELEHRFELKGLLLSAAQAGNLEIIELLMPMIEGDHELVNYNPVLAQTLEKAHSTRQKKNEIDKFLNCAKYLIECNAVSLHKTTNSGNTPLHLAVKYGYDEVVVALLENGCGSLGVCNQANLTPLECGTRSFWKACFDKFIKGDSSKQDWKSIDFETNCFQSPDIDSNATATHAGWKKFNPIRSASQASVRPEERVVVTEMTPLRRMAESKELKRLLTHPVIYAFVMVKWVRLSTLHLLNLLLTMVTIGSFGWYSLSVCNVVDLHSSLHYFLKFLIILVSILTLLREGIQMYLLPRSYATLENLVDISNIVAIVVIVFFRGCDPILSSLVLLVFSLQMVFILSALPFKQLSTIMYMFKTVAVNFIQSLLLFLPLICAFVFAFYLTYNGNNAVTELNRTYASNETSDDADNETKDDEDFHKFRTVMDAVVKTVVMTTGEFDAADLDLTGGKVFLFLVFLFIAPLVILNLMNGLAVSDIQAIQEKSELISISKKVIELERIERLMVSLRPEWIRRKFPNQFLKHHSSKIGVRIDELGKILVRHKQKEQSSLPNTEGNGVAVPLLDNHSDLNSKPNQKDTNSQPLFPPIFSEGTDIVLDFGFLQLTSFLTLDRTILAEALSVIEDRTAVKRCKYCKQEL
ncbi:transient receptor potential cation channel protein painless-like [Anopheles aquasalis]|uniref:transient receptor potential cation channel protein painless-like n=1 Tax=Anopheles aquasalis TaxID=42839 RepID=UPI00215A96E9|nr:transient receptor potential cation channel protein painless-like [Anopheles aquasalis]